MKKLSILFITLLLCHLVAFAIDVRPGSEYISERIIRDTNSPGSNAYPMALTISTLENGNVRFSIAAVQGDATTVTWNDQGLVHDSGDAQLWFGGESHLLKDYFNKNKTQTGNTEFELVPSKAIPAGSVIVYKTALQWKYGSQTVSTAVRGKQDYIIYTYGTDASNPDVTSICEMHLYQNNTNDAYLTASTDENGKITFEIKNEAGTAYFRADDGGGMNADAMILRSFNNTTWMGKKMSDYFDRTTITNNVDNIPQNQKIVFTPKSGVTVPEDLVISYYDSQIAWRIGTTAAWNKFPWRYHYGTGCTAGKTIKAAATDVAKYSAKITLDKSKFYDGAAYKIKIKEAGGEYSYVSGGPFSESDFPYTLTGLNQGVTYNVVVEGAYPSFDAPEDEKSSNTVSFTTLVSGSEICDRPFVSDVYSIGVSMETTAAGDLVWKITSSNPEGATWRNDNNPPETYAKYANTILVNGQSGSNYFNDPVLSDDWKSAILVPKAAIPDGAQITLNQKWIVWFVPGRNASIYTNDGTQFDDFTYTYGKYCCAQGSIKLQAADIKRSSANIHAAKKCLDDDALAYVYRFKYKESSASEYTVIDGFQSLYSLEGLSVSTQYDAVLEAAYPSFESPELSWSGTTSFTTKSMVSEVCDLEFTSGGSTAAFSFVTAASGDMELLIGGSETNYAFRNNPSIDKFQVNGAAASTYFDATYLSTDKTKVILPLKSGSAIKADDEVKFNDGTLEWKSDAEGNAWVTNKTFSTRYLTACCTEGEQLTAELTSVQTNSASIKITDACLEGKGYVYRLRYTIDGVNYTTVSGRPSDGVYNLSNLLSSTDYTAIAEAAYPSFESATKPLEQATVEFTTLSKGSEVCDVQFTSGLSTIGVSMESTLGGDVTITLSTDEANGHFRAEGLSSNIDDYKVNAEAASLYFNNPVMNAGQTVITLSKKADLPAGAVINFNGVIAWSTDLNTNAYVMGAELSHTYGTVCCDVSGFKITRCEGLSNSTAIVEINNLCIEDKPYLYRYSLKAGEGEYGAPVSFTGLTINLSGLASATSYNIKIEAAIPDFDNPTDVREQIGTFTTAALSPAPVPTYAENLVMTVYSSTYGEAENLDWNYYTFVKELSDEVISSESVLKKCVMNASPIAGKESQNGVLIRYPGYWDVSSMMYLHFDLWISSSDAEKSPYVGLKLRHEDGVNNSWYICNDQLVGNEWNSFDVPLSWFADNESLNLTEVLSMMIIPLATKTGSIDDAQFSAEEYTIYLDNIFYFVPGAAKIDDTYYDTLAEAVTAAQDDDEVVLLIDVTEDLNVAGKSISFDAGGHSIASVVVASDASLTLTSDMTLTSDLILKSDISAAGQFIADGNAVTVGGDAFFDKKFSTSSKITWYAFSLPFSVSIDDISDAATGTHLDYADEVYANYYDGATRAGGNDGWTDIDDGNLTPGKLYIFTIRQADKYQEIRFKAADKSALFAGTTIDLNYYTGSGDESMWGWNGIGNNQLYNVAMSVEGISFGQVYNTSSRGYDLVTLSGHSFNAGDAIFIQSSAAGQSAELSKSSTKSAEASYNPYILEISATGVDATDKCFVTVSDDATASYQIGKDLVKMGDFKSYDYATLWVEAYGKQLAVVDAKSQSGATDITLGINAPKAGSYSLNLSSGDIDKDVYLTLGGEVIWDFADGAYALNLKQGAASVYGLRIEGDVPTSVAEEEAGSNKAIKYIENGAVVIEVNGVRYNLQGIIIK